MLGCGSGVDDGDLDSVAAMGRWQPVESHGPRAPRFHRAVGEAGERGDHAFAHDLDGFAGPQPRSAQSDRPAPACRPDRQDRLISDGLYRNGKFDPAISAGVADSRKSVANQADGSTLDRPASVVFY